jgi:magnesium transporter
MARSRRYRDGKLEAEDFPIEELSDYRVQPDAVLWVDLCSPTMDELHVLAEELGLHELAVEDAVSEHQRPKLDRYEGHLFLNVYAVRLNTESGQLEKVEVSAFVTENVLVTVRRSKDFDIDAVLARWDGAPHLAKYGVGFLLHGLLDYVVDGHLDAVQALDDEIGAQEDDVFAERPAPNSAQRRSFALHKSLVLLRRMAVPTTEVVNGLLRGDLKVVEPPMVAYFQDVHDHTLRTTEWTESLRELIGTVLDARLSLQSNRMNGIMKKVTSWAAIIAVPTAVSGYYGQNVPYPGYQQHIGWYTSTALIAGMSVGLYVLFRRLDWL